MAPVPSKIIYQAIALYRGNFIQFFWLSLRSAMWAFVAVASFVISIAGLFSWPIFEFTAPPSPPISEDARYLVVLIVSVILTFVLFVFASAQVELKTALIGRLAYQHLIAQPESLAPIADVVKARFWHFWMAEVYIGVILTAMNRLIDRWVPDAIWSILLETFIYILISGQYFLTSMLISVDLDTARQAWRNSKKQFDAYPIEICAVLVFTWLMTLPLYLLALAPVIAIVNAEWNSFAETADFAQMFTAITHIVQAGGLSIVLTMILHALIIPLWQSIKAVLYQVVNTRSV
jgi:hypothetical protein